MSTWTYELELLLENEASPSVFFVRDDDAGWADSRFFELVEVVAASGVRLDVAAIPAALVPPTARRLSELAVSGVVSVHQHGWRHANHEQLGRRCEFGASREEAQLVGDLLEGAATLRGLLSGALEPFFTPPWNRCDDRTADLLPELGFTVLSCDRSAPQRRRAGLAELPVAIDWVRSWREGGPAAVAAACCRAVRSRPHLESIGVMVHHAAMSAVELEALDRLLSVLQAAASSTLSSMAEIVACRQPPPLGSGLPEPVRPALFEGAS